MHEVAVATQIATIVTRAAQGRRVLAVNVEVGALRQVVPASLHSAWRYVTRHTLLDDAVLNLRLIPVTARCSCGVETRMDTTLNLVCPRCGKGLEVVDGNQLRVVDIETRCS